MANRAPTGSVKINGLAQQKQVLIATNTLADADGLGTISYQWYADGVAISGATGSSLTLSLATVGKAITVVASYTDGLGKAEAVSSAATAKVSHVNTVATGTVTISGIVQLGQTLTAVSTLADIDGMGTLAYQWKANGIAISGATGSSYTLTAADVGKIITVSASFTDGYGAVESASSAATAKVANVNHLPTGSVVIAGTALEGQTLVASNTLADSDGLGTIAYQWKANGVAISGATGSSYTLATADVGKIISVAASYTDGYGTAESVSSAPTAAVTRMNRLPTGSVVITGTALEGQTLVAGNTLADADGVGTVSYQWKANGTAISGATGSGYTLTAADVGKYISVAASYTDGYGTAESVSSLATVAVTHLNRLPTGSVTITGTVQQGQTLIAGNTLADADGVGTVSYQWKANGTAITGATGSSYTLAAADVGKTITVAASYTDGYGTAESVSSAATGRVVSAITPAQQILGVSPLQERTFLYQGTGTLTMSRIDNPFYLTVANASSGATTALDTASGGLVGLATYGTSGRVAVVGNTGAINQALQTDPTSGGWARLMFNLYSWLSDQQRTVGQAQTLHVLRASDTSATVDDNQSLFLEFFSTDASYSGQGTPAVGVNVAVGTSLSGSRAIIEALAPNGAWTRNYGVVALPSNANQDVIAVVEQWMQATGGGVLIETDPAYGMSAAVKGFISDVGLNVQTGPTLVAGNYTPTLVDPKNAAFVASELTGGGAANAGQSAASPIYIQNDINLPQQILGGTVTWTSSDQSIVTAAGKVLNQGTAALTAHVTFADGSTVADTFYYNVFRPVAGSGLDLRIVSTNGYKVNGSTPSVTDINAYMTNSLLGQTPIYDASVTGVNFSTQTSSYPAGGSGALWTYSGYLMPQTSGTYTFRLSADDSAKFYIKTDSGIGSQTAAWWSSSDQSVTLQAGQAYQIWAFFKPGGGSDNVSLQWQQPGASGFAAIPASAFAQPASGLLPANAGYPANLLPWTDMSGAAGASLSSTTIISPAALTALNGNTPPVANNQEFNFPAQGVFFTPENLSLTNAVAAKAKTVSITLTDPAGAHTVNVNSQDLSGVTDGASLAASMQTVLNAADVTAGGSGSIIVAYVNGLISVTDTAGRAISNLILAGTAPTAPRIVSGATSFIAGSEAVSGHAAVASVADVKFDPAIASSPVRINLTLTSSVTGKTILLKDLMFQGIGLNGVDFLTQNLQDAVQKAMGTQDVTITWDGAHNQFVFQDALGRSFTSVTLTDSPTYTPLVEMAGTQTGGNGSPSVAVLGGISGQVQSSDVNGDTLSYSVLEQPKFGTMTLDPSTGKYVYKPLANGSFHGWDQFTVNVSDGHGGTSGPVAVSISNMDAPQVSVPVSKTFSVPDPTYIQPAAHPNVVVPSDFVLQDVFIAQTHVNRPTDPYLTLTADRYALIKVNVTSASGAAAPDLTATVKDKNGNVLGSLRLTGPGNLPTSVDLPTMANYGAGSQTNADSYVAPLPSAWIQPGISISITAGSNPTPINSFSPYVGPNVPLTVYDMSASLYGTNASQYLGGVVNWGQDALANLPAGSINLVQFPALPFNSFGVAIGGAWDTYTGNISGFPGSDARVGGGFLGNINWEIRLAGQFRNANSNYDSLVYIGDSPGAGGGLGGGSIGGGDATPGIFWHELAGHGEGRPHAASDAAYPYNNAFPNGVAAGAQNGWLGPNWGYDQFTGQYQPVSVVQADGSVSLYTDPMAGGYQVHPNNNFGMFSDYYNYLNMQYLRGQMIWQPDPTNAVDGGFAGDGYYQTWNNTTQQWVVVNKSNYGGSEADLAWQHNVPVYWLSFPLIAPDGSGATPGGQYSAGLQVLPIRTIGNLKEPLHDIVTGAGRPADSDTLNGNYVMRVTYATGTGLITENLIIPGSYGTGLMGINIADKGELVRVDIIEAPKANLRAYLDGKTVSSYVNSQALANTVFSGNSLFTAEMASLVLPKYWNGAQVNWMTTVPGLVDLNTGKIDVSKLSSTSAIRAEWVEGGALRVETFVLKLPDTANVMEGLFGVATDQPQGVGISQLVADKVLPASYAGGSVVWSTSNANVLSATGHIVSAGNAVLTATVTYANGAVRTYSEGYTTETERAITTATGYVTNELFGQATSQANIATPQLATKNLVLPGTVAHGTVVWSSSDPTIINASGQLLSAGTATLTATVTFDDATVQTYSHVYDAMPERAATTSTAYVMNELFGKPFSQANVATAQLMTSNLSLPSTIAHGTVIWTTSDATKIGANGSLNGAGNATLTAHVTFDDGATQTYSMAYAAITGSGLTTGGLLRRIVNVSNYTVGGSSPDGNTITPYETATVFGMIPVASQTGALLDWAKPQGASANYASFPAGSMDASGNLINGFWSYTGFVVPTVTGTYQFNIKADNCADLYVQANGVLQNVTTTSGDISGGGKTITVNLTAGEAAPIWVFYHPGGTYWADSLDVTWKTPGAASFTTIPATNLAAPPASLVAANAGYPTNLLPQTASSQWSSPLGLQLRIIDLSNWSYSGPLSGMDQYLTQDVLSRTPIFSGTGLPDLTVTAVGAYKSVAPAADLNASGYALESLWTFSGYILPTVTGTYTFSFTADDAGRVYVGQGAAMKTADHYWSDGGTSTFTMDLTAGEVVPVWVFFKSQTPGSYWGDWVNLQWKLPGAASFTSIPAAQLAPMSDTMVPPTGGYPPSLLPQAVGAQWNSPLGLQLRIVDLTGYTYSGSASGIDQYLTPDVLSRTPIFSGTGVPDLTVTAVGAYKSVAPAADLNASGYALESLWTYSGYLLPTVSGTYTFSFTADDAGRVYIGQGAAMKTADHYVNGGNPATFTMDLTAGQAVPVWVFFKSQTPGSYWADWVHLQWQAPGSASFTAIPLSQMAPMSDSLVSPTGGYPTSLLPFSPTTMSVAGTTVSDSTVFTPLGQGVVTQLGSVANLTAVVADQAVVSGGLFNEQFIVPAILGGASMQHWVKLQVMQADGTMKEQDPLEAWTVKVQGTLMTVSGTIDSIPNLNLVGVKVYTDDNLVDSTPPVSVTFQVNRGPVLELIAGKSNQFNVVTGSGSNYTLDQSASTSPVAVTGGSGDGTIIGSTKADLLYGGSGNDAIQGGTGSDTLILSGGVDVLHGQPAGVAAGSELNTLAIMVSTLDHTQVQSTAQGVRIVNTDDGTDVYVANAGASSFDSSLALYQITGTWQGQAVSTTQAITKADGIQAFLVSDGKSSLGFAVGVNAAGTSITAGAEASILRNAAGGVTLSDSAFTDPALRGIRLFGGDGGDTFAVGSAKSVTVDGGAGTDTASLVWPGGLPADLTSNMLTVSEDAATGAFHVDAVSGNGTVHLLDVSQVAAGQKDYLASMHLVSNQVVQDELINVETLQLGSIGSASMQLGGSGMTGLTLSANADAVLLQADRAIAVDGGAGSDTVTINWGVLLPGLAADHGVSLSQDAATSVWHVKSGSNTLLDLMQTNAGQNRYTVTLHRQDGSTMVDTVANVETLVFPELAGFSLQLGAAGVTGVISGAGADQAQVSTGVATNINTGDGVDTVVARWSGTSLPSLAGQSALTVTRDTGTFNWHLSAGGVSLLDMVQVQAGQNAFTLTMHLANGGTQSQTLTNVEFLSLPQLDGLMNSLASDPMFVAGNDLTLRVKNAVFLATIDNTIGTNNGVAQTIQGGGLTKDNTLALTGQADPGAVVQVYDGVQLLGTATRDGLNWAFTTPALADGMHSLTARVTDNSGNVATTGAVAANVRTSLREPELALVTHDSTVGGLVTSGNATSQGLQTNGAGTIVFSANDATKYGNAGTAFTDTATGTADLFVADGTTGKIGLVTHGATNTTGSAGVAVTFNAISADGQYVIFSNPNDASKFGNGGTAITEPYPSSNVVDILAYKVSDGTQKLVSHSSAAGNATASATQSTYRGMSGDGQYVIFGVGNITGVGNNGTAFTGSGGQLIAYKLSDGTQSVITHSATAGNTNATGGGTYAGVSSDGQYVLFTANDATKYGNGGTAFTDTATGSADLFAYRFSDGNIQLLSHASGNSSASAGGSVSYAGMSADGQYVILSTNDASKFGFTDGNTSGSDLIAVKLSDGSLKLISHLGNNISASGTGSAQFLKSVGNMVYFVGNDGTQYGASSDANTSGNDLFRYDLSTGTTTLLSRASFANGATLGGAVSTDASRLLVSADNRYVAFADSLSGGTYGSFNISIGGDALFLDDTQNSTVALVNHDGSSNNELWYAAWGGGTARAFTPDGQTLIFTNSYAGYLGVSAGGSDNSLLAYNIATGAQTVLSHNAAGTGSSGSINSFAGMTPDGQTVLFTASDATAFGNSGVAFTDSATASADLISANLATGEMRLISGINGASLGSAVTYLVMSQDGNYMYMGGVTNVAGLPDGGAVLTDNNGAGGDIVAVRLNLLDLATASDTSGSGAGTSFDNITASHALTLNALLNPSQSAQLLDNGQLIGTATADSMGQASWTLQNVASGTHSYSLQDSTEQVPLTLGGSAAMSTLKVTVL